MSNKNIKSDIKIITIFITFTCVSPRVVAYSSYIHIHSIHSKDLKHLLNYRKINSTIENMFIEKAVCIETASL